MSTLLLVAFVVVMVLVVLQVMKARVEASRPWPYVTRRQVLSAPEQVLHHRLVRALPGHLVLAHVQVSRVLDVRRGRPVRGWLNRIDRLSYDFVVCTADARPICAVELDDRSHAKPARREVDERKDRATAAAGLPLIRWNVGALPDEVTIRGAVVRTGTAHAGNDSRSSAIGTPSRAAQASDPAAT